MAEGDDDDDESNLVASCRACNERKRIAEANHGRRRTAQGGGSKVYSRRARNREEVAGEHAPSFASRWPSRAEKLTPGQRHGGPDRNVPGIFYVASSKPRPTWSRRNVDVDKAAVVGSVRTLAT